MKNLKIISLYSILIASATLLTINNINQKSKFNSETKINGIVNKISKDKTQIELISKEKIIVKTYQSFDLKLGTKIEVEGTLESPSNNTLFNTFNYKKYLKSKKINYIFKAKSIKILKENKDIKYRIKNNIIKHIEKYKTSNYLKTFILGENDELDNDVIKSFQENGISHLFAISGMHLSLFSLIISSILKKITDKEVIVNIIIILFLVFFAFLADYSPSVLRALILYILLAINKTLNLNIKTIKLIIIDLIILLLYNPFYIYSVGFVYSFSISISLILSSSIINNYKNNIKKTFITSLISFIVSIPITINNFFEINVLTPFINIVFIPIISFIIFPLSLITFFIRPIDGIFSLSIKILELLSKKIRRIKINIILTSIPWYIVIIYYLLIIIFIKGIKNKKTQLLIPLIVLLAIHSNINQIIKKTRITYLDVGQGDSIFVEKNNKSILIDTGGNKNFKIVENKTIPYLKSLGIKTINYLILTHGDYDHMGEAINLVENFKVEKVIFNCGPYNDLEKELIKVLDKNKIKYYSCIKELSIDKNKLYFLQTKEYDNENDNSNVIYTELNGYKFMFMGDASSSTEKEIMSKNNLPNIDVLKVGHHGSKTSSSKEFIDDINPKYSIISVGKNNHYGHPNKEVLNNLEDSKIYRTDKDGSIMFKINNNKLKIETCSP